MSSSSLTQYLPAPMALARGTCVGLGLLGMATGSLALFNPGMFLKTFFCLPNAPASTIESARRNAFIRVLGGRTIASAVGIFGLAALKLDRAIGVSCIAAVIAGGVDGWSVFNFRPAQELTGKGAEADGKEAFKAALCHWALLGCLPFMGGWMVMNGEH
ncbi:hypothetical protein GGR57DRAFT_510154 [Xylariaceae sp. FL1272]|nr:hypothetical protein GGR57DRAFT_510154 [Xylariaceae sp. FL1272]